jgi:hypothetical protein
MGISPFAQGGLDEALGLAIGLWSVGAGEAVLEAEGGDGFAHGVGAVAGAIVGVDALDGDAVLFEESQCGVKEGDGALGGLVWEKLGEGETAVVIDGDVEVFPTGAAGVIALTVAGDAMAGAFDAGELLDVEMEQLARERALVTLDWRRRRKLRQAETMAAQETGDAGFGEPGSAGDLEARQPAAAQSQDAGDTERVGGFGGTFWARTAVVEAGSTLGAETGEPFEDRALGNAKSGGDGAHGVMEFDDAVDDLGSTERGEPSLTVQVHAAVVLGWVLCDNPTFPSPRRMNNLLERHS